MSEFDYSGLPGQEQADLFREVAISRHPGAAPFADLLVGGDLESVIALAKDVESRMSKGGSHKTAATSTANVGQQTPTAPVEEQQTAATMHAALKARAISGQPNAPEDKRDWFTAKLAEAAGQ